MWAPEELTSPGRDCWPWVPNISFKEKNYIKIKFLKKIINNSRFPN